RIDSRDDLFILLEQNRRPAPPTTLFPYTTLFRSSSHSDAAMRCPTMPPGAWKASANAPQVAAAMIAIVASTSVLTENLPQRPGVDRKSTRLNSSHVKISYAVFCSKKKTTSHTRAH